MLECEHTNFYRLCYDWENLVVDYKVLIRKMEHTLDFYFQALDCLDKANKNWIKIQHILAHSFEKTHLFLDIFKTSFNQYILLQKTYFSFKSV